MDKEQLQTLYAREGYYWGTEPNALASKALDFTLEAGLRGRLLDLGAGEGRDSVFFAQQGFEVVAFDVAANGLAKAQRLAGEKGTWIRTLQGDINNVSLEGCFEVVYSIGALQYLEPVNRARQFSHFQAKTKPGGVHVLFAFIEHSDVEQAPDWGQNEYLYEPGELRSHYQRWASLSEEAIVFDCDFGGIPHQHAAEILVVQKPS